MQKASHRKQQKKTSTVILLEQHIDKGEVYAAHHRHKFVVFDASASCGVNMCTNCNFGYFEVYVKLYSLKKHAHNSALKVTINCTKSPQPSLRSTKTWVPRGPSIPDRRSACVERSATECRFHRFTSCFSQSIAISSGVATYTQRWYKDSKYRFFSWFIIHVVSAQWRSSFRTL